jgi:hypothetical protein
VACASLASMSAALKARVRQGRLVLDEPTTLPEGWEVPLSVDSSEQTTREQWERQAVGLFLEAAVATASPDDLEHYARVIAGVRARAGGELDLDEEDREELDQGLRQALEEARAGKGISTEEVFQSMDRAARAALPSP